VFVFEGSEPEKVGEKKKPEVEIANGVERPATQSLIHRPGAELRKRCPFPSGTFHVPVITA
jgi:hypothetical protein